MYNIDKLVQDCGIFIAISSALVMDLPQPCIEPLIYCWWVSIE